jgi:hypothetical protein
MTVSTFLVDLPAGRAVAYGDDARRLLEPLKSRPIFRKGVDCFWREGFKAAFGAERRGEKGGCCSIGGVVRSSPNYNGVPLLNDD